MPARILVVDDEPDLLELVRVNLRQAGYRVECAPNALAGLRALRAHPPDLLVLDLMLPDLSGMEVCRRVRAAQSTARLPVIMLTARGEEVDRVAGFEVGADDYLTKPFSPRELTLRVQALLRRTQNAEQTPAPQTLKYGSLALNSALRSCTVRGAPVALTKTEFRMLEELMRRAGQVLSRETLMEAVWGEEMIVTTRTVDVHMRRLRLKLQSAGTCLQTVRGFGYRFAEAETETEAGAAAE